MSSNDDEKALVASPAATGLSGGFFEQHVGATWLALLLVRAIPPLLIDSQVVRVAFQTRRLGWETDDVLVFAETGARKNRKLIAQVKRSFTVSSSNEECRKTFRAFWADFSNAQFDRVSDRLCLITLRGTNSLLVHLAGLIECASASTTFDDFKSRLETPGLLHATSKKYAEEIRNGLTEDKVLVSDEDFWLFLRSIAVLSFDLNSSTSQTESWIKTLLAHSATGADKIGSADSTWNSLLALVAKAMPEARDISRDDLPELLRQAHDPIPNSDHKALHALGEHSATILRGIRGTIHNSVALKRAALVEETRRGLVGGQVLLIAGPAGSGKSAVAKSVLERLGDRHFTFAFRAEEFAKAHLDETLNGSGLAISGTRLSAVLAGQGQKVLLIESVERLLEASIRDSFSDLLRLIEKDASWKVVLTCRAYSLDLVVASFFGQMGLPYSVVKVPPLSDDELDEVGRAIPNLAIPLSSKKLRRILSNPYVLDKASRMTWSQGEQLPENEREFRRRFWRDIVRQDDKREQGLPLRREQVVTEVALRRARALSLHAKSDDLDQEALRKAHQDDLVVFSEASDTLAAPAHDVLEDWALLNWLELKFAQTEGSARKVAEEVGTYPALRRSYLMWLSERSDLDEKGTDDFVSSVLADASLAAHFRDDTIVSILRAEAGAGFLRRNRQPLLADGSKLLKRVVHLLRVACKEMPDWLAGIGYIQSSVMIPTGSAWPQAVALVAEAINDFVSTDPELALGLVEDWSNQVNVENLYPDGHQDTAKVAFALLAASGGYRHDKIRKRIFTVLSKVPSGDKEAFLALMKRAAGGDRDAEEFAKFLLGGMHATYVAREVPDALIELTKHHIYVREKEDSHPFARYQRLDVDEFFGMQGHRDFYPPSAFRGPFLPLLRQHFRKGVDFIIEFVNHAGEAYSKPPEHDRLEPAWEVEVVLPDGTIRKQWHNPRLWQLYRGTSVGPYVLMCALMTLEHILLKMSEAKHLDAWLTYILSKSNNSALSAVVSSVVVANSSKCKQTARSLLSCRDFIELDQNLAAVDRGMSAIQGMFPSLNAESKMYEEERKEADALPHRSKSLLMVALELQATDVREEIQNIIDLHLKRLPGVETQSNADRMWRFALHKMDLRQYSPKVATKRQIEQAQGKESSDESDGDEPAGLILEPKTPDKDIVAVIERQKPRIESDQNLIGLLNWGWACFIRDAKAVPTLWKQVLEKAMATKTGDGGEQPLAWDRAPALVGAVCARDHWHELNAEQKRWCLGVMGQVVAHERDSTDHLVHVSRHAMSADRPCAVAASAVLATETDPSFCEQAKCILFDALFHACEEVSMYAASGISQFLWSKQDDLAMKCAKALVARALELDRRYEVERVKPYREQVEPYLLQVQVSGEILKKLKKGDTFADVDVSLLDFEQPYASEALKLFLHLFGDRATGDVTKNFYGRVVAQICRWWANEDRDERVPYELVYACADRVARFVLNLSPADAVQLCQPFLPLVDSKPREVSTFVRDLVSAEDSSHIGRETFWALWDVFAGKIRAARWLPRLNSEYFSNDEILRAIFLGLHWKQGSKRWEPHVGYEDRIVGLFERLPASDAVLDQMAVYLYYIGDMTLPGAFIPLAAKVKGAPSILSDSNSIFCLEQVLQRHVYGAPQRLKVKPELREAVITLLDEMVEKGSSAAFKMRDDFVTPMKG